MTDPQTFAVQAFEKRTSGILAGASLPAGCADEAVRRAAAVADLLGGAVALAVVGEAQNVLAVFGDVPEGYQATG